MRLFGAPGDVVEIALAWRQSGKPQVHGFVSQFAATEGTHIEGFLEGFCGVWVNNDVFTEDVSSTALREALGEGLVAVVHVAMYETRFGAPRALGWRVPTDARRCMP